MDPPSSFTGLEMKIYVGLTRRASFVSSTHHLLHFPLRCTASASLTMLKYLDYVKSGNVNFNSIITANIVNSLLLHLYSYLNLHYFNENHLRFVSNNFRRKASVSEMLHNLGWQSLDVIGKINVWFFFFTKLLMDSHQLKRRTSSRQLIPVQGRITASNSNTSRQIVIHVDFPFFQPLFRAGTTFHLALRRLTV